VSAQRNQTPNPAAASMTSVSRPNAIAYLVSECPFNFNTLFNGIYTYGTELSNHFNK
jgi:hypothetical protein